MNETEDTERRPKPKRPAVIAFGRFQPPTIGHARLVEFLRFEAGRRKATPVLFPSPTQDPGRNPLPFAEKVKFLRQLFPGLAVSGNPAVRTPIDALVLLKRMGFDAVWFVSGSDRANEFRTFDKYVSFKDYGVIPIARHESTDAVTGMSGTKLRTAAQQDDWTTFQAGVPTKNDRIARQMYDSIRRHMGLVESTRQRVPAFLLFGTSNASARQLRESFERYVKRVHSTVRYRDISELTFMDIKRLTRLLEHRGYAPTIYVKEAPLPRTITETWVKTSAIYGQLRRLPNTITLSGTREMVIHAETVFEEVKHGAAGAPKEPSEADRLRSSQKQGDVLAKRREGEEMLAAKERDLQKQSREQLDKLNQPKGTK